MSGIYFVEDIEGIEFELEGFLEVVKKGFVDILIGKISLYILWRIIMVIWISFCLVVQKLVLFLLSFGKENFVEFFKLIVGGSRL